MPRSLPFLMKKLARTETVLRSAIAARRAAKAAIASCRSGHEAHLIEALRLAQEDLDHCNARDALLINRGLYDPTTAGNTYRAVLAFDTAQTALNDYLHPSSGPVCPHCSQRFHSSRADQIYCSRPCKSAAKTRRQRTSK